VWVSVILRTEIPQGPNRAGPATDRADDADVGLVKSISEINLRNLRHLW
jgi:hypothetical protein